MNYCFQISYDGTNYSGWQIQKNAFTIQEEIQSALQTITQTSHSIVGCGRTDSGVHARDFYFNVKSNEEWTAEVLHKLNSICSHSIAFKKMWLVPDEFNSRFDAIARTYKYEIHTQKDPFLDAYSLWFRYDLQIEAMNEACKYLLGTQDFECFSKVKTEVNNFMCTIEDAQFDHNGHQLTFTITANRFLRNMVRAIMGTLLEIGTGQKTSDQMISIINSKDRAMAGRSVEAKGLFLDKITYDKSKWQNLD